MNPRRMAWFVAIAAGVAFSTAHAIEAPLKFEETNAEAFHLDQYFGLQTTAPPGNWKLPVWKSKEPVYCTVRLGSPRTEYLVALDRQKPDDAFFSRLYFDANGNHDLTDDPPLDGEIKTDRNWTSTKFSAVSLNVDVNGHALPYRFVPEVKSYNAGMVVRFLEYVLGDRGDGPVLRVKTDCFYSAALKLGNDEYEVALLDSNGNGCFGDPMVLRRARGTVRVFSDGDEASIVRKGARPPETLYPLGQWLVIKDTLYKVALDIPGGKLDLIPRAEPTGRLKLTSAFQEMGFSDTMGSQGVTVIDPAESIPFPVGTYALCDYQMTRNDEQGDQWILSGAGNASTPGMKIEADKEASMAFGEPFTTEIKVVGNAIRGGFLFSSAYAMLEFETLGAARESVSEIRRVSGDKTKIPLSDRDHNRPREPGFKVLTADGEVVAQGQFRYG